MKLRVGRRAVLRGLAYGGAISVGLPVLECMLDTSGKALADGTPLPKRFGVFFWGNGLRMAKYLPSAVGAYTLTESLAPLMNVKDYVSIVSGYDIKTGNERGHHAGCVGILSGAPMVSQDPKGAPYASTFSAPSIDQVVASSVGMATRFKSLEVGISKSVTTGEGTTLRYLSHNGPDNPNPPEYSPKALYTRVFGTGFTAPNSGTAAIDPKLALRKSVLSAVRDDATDLRKRLGKSDQTRLDQHFESIRALENQISSVEQAPPPPTSCSAPAMPTDTAGDSKLSMTNATMANLVALSLACDQTRVFSYMFSGSVGGTSYPELSISTNHHTLSHDEGGDQPQVQQISVFILQRFAALLEALKAVPEGTGNLLDNCVILASSDVTEGQPHSINNYPIIIAGGGGGALVHPGIHIKGNKGNASDVLLTLLQAMDLPLTEFGKAGGLSKTPVAMLRKA
ncbi:MAG TPA: DUF1552 domain-containing protein [Polyangiales bacterium]|nr:DUF1552 domain-containing protein [Polyangiales bacterium]